MSTFLENQNWRYATKKFDATKKITDADLAFLKEAIRLSTSSYGLQPYKVFIVENPELRAKLVAASYGQAQVADASHLLVFANELNFGEAGINQLAATICKTRELPLEAIQGYVDFMKGSITGLPEETRNIWTAKQTYLALGNLLNAAAELNIDVTPMEGFEPEKVNEILSLNEKGLNASLIATIGYRHAEDATQSYAKVRKSEQELFINL